jgi:hypothetical protein
VTDTGAATLQIEGCVIVSADGMLADEHGLMPDALKFPGDQHWFEALLDSAALIVHGRNSHEDQPRSHERQRIVLTHAVAATAPDPSNPKATLWNPAGASFAQACAQAGVTTGRVAVIGGPVVFRMFLDRYDTFWLSHAPQLRLPGGRPAFGLPGREADDILAEHGLMPRETRMLDPAHGVTLTAWRRQQPAAPAAHNSL